MKKYPKSLLLVVGLIAGLVITVALWVLVQDVKYVNNTPSGQTMLCLPVNLPHANKDADLTYQYGFPFKMHGIENECEGNDVSATQARIHRSFTTWPFYADWAVWSAVVIMVLVVNKRQKKS